MEVSSVAIHDYIFNILPGVGKPNNSLTGHSVLDRKRKKKRDHTTYIDF